MPDARQRGEWHDDQMAEDACPDCGTDFGAVWQVKVGTNMRGYTPVFDGPVVADIGRCDNCNTSSERIDGGAWCRQGSQ